MTLGAAIIPADKVAPGTGEGGGAGLWAIEKARAPRRHLATAETLATQKTKLRPTNRRFKLSRARVDFLSSSRVNMSTDSVHDGNQ